MRLPVLRGVIERRILLNYRVAPETVAELLPSGFRPQSVGDWAVAGVCLIRLAHVRPRGLPGWIGPRLENAAIRMAATWDEAGTTKRGVFVHRRDTGSRFAAWAGGRVFPGVHHRAEFAIRETDQKLSVAYDADDGLSFALEAEITDQWPSDSVFADCQAASDFFAAGGTGYSWNPRRGELEGLELRVERWKVAPLAVRRVASSFFDDPARFPAGSIMLDNALLMRNIAHEWHTL